MAAKRTTITYVGGGGARRFTEADGFSEDLAFTRGEPVEVSAADAKALLEFPGEFVEGEVDAERLGVPYVEAQPTAGSATDNTGDVPGPSEPWPDRPPDEPEDENDQAAESAKEG